MDVFGEQVLDAISKIRKRNERPDAETIFKHISIKFCLMAYLEHKTLFIILVPIFGDSVETPKIKNTNTSPLNEVHVENFNARFVAIKAFFMN